MAGRVAVLDRPFLVARVGEAFFFRVMAITFEACGYP